MPIEFDYTIKRYEGTRTRVFKPEAIKSPLSNISIISAPNSSGKSTLMNLIALSLFGTDNKAVAVNESLKKQLSILTDESIQHIIFWLKITDRSGKNGLFISKEKYESMDIVRKEIVDGIERNIDSDRFHGKYKLIYDIPDNPLERLKELTYNIRDQQTRWRSRLIPLSSYLNENIKDLIKRKQEYDITSLEHSIGTARENIDNSKNNQLAFEAKLSSLEKYYYLKKYLHLEEKYDSIKDESKEINKVKKEQNDLKNRKIEEFKETAQERGIIQEDIKRQEEMIARTIIETRIIDLPDLEKWSAGIKQAPSSQSLKEDLEFTDRLAKRCALELNKDESKSSVGEVEFYDKLLDWLRNNMTSNYKIPSTEMTFSSLVSKLDEIVTKSRKLLDNRRRLENAIELIKTLKKSIHQYEELGQTISQKYSEMSHAQIESKIKEISDEKKDYAAIKKELKKDMQSIIFELSKLGIKDEKEFQRMLNTLIIRFPELESYDSFPLDKIEIEISGIKSKIERMKGDQQREELKVKTLEKQLTAAKNAEPHRFEGNEDKLRILLGSINSLIQTITRWDGYIGNYESKNGSVITNMKTDPEGTDYFNRISQYLANRMMTVDHIDQKYELKEVDLINSKFVAKDGTVIQFQVMGTGQKQLTHILNKLSYDGRVIIAMFDEVAMMSPSTMHDIVNKMRGLMDDGGKLLAGLLVSPSDRVNITDG